MVSTRQAPLVPRSADGPKRRSPSTLFLTRTYCWFHQCRHAYTADGSARGIRGPPQRCPCGQPAAGATSWCSADKRSTEFHPRNQLSALARSMGHWLRALTTQQSVTKLNSCSSHRPPITTTRIPSSDATVCRSMYLPSSFIRSCAQRVRIELISFPVHSCVLRYRGPWTSRSARITAGLVSMRHQCSNPNCAAI
jgi:hypothetical protein